MTLYELIRRVSNIITPETDDFYHYILYTSDDNGGFLRTRYCWWDKPLVDRDLCGEYQKVLVACQKEISANLINKQDTRLKLQLHYDWLDMTMEDMEWDIEMGYCYIYLFDFVANEFTMEYRESPI